MRVIELRPELLQHRLVHAALERAERVKMTGRASRRPRPFQWWRAGHPHLRQPIGQAHAARLLRLERTRRPCDGSPSRRCCTSFAIAWLTGCPGLSSVMGTPLLIEIGTARLDGMYAEMGHRTAFSTCSRLSPTLESDRLTTTERICLG